MIISGRNVKLILIFFLGAAMVCFSGQFAFAHKVTVFAWKEGGRVFTESRFSGGKRVKNGRIEVYDDSGKKILDGKTDDQGCFSFDLPVNKHIDIVLKAGAGHQAHWQMTDDSPDDTIAEGDITKPEHAKQPDSINVTPGELEAIIENALDKKLKPVLSMVKNQQYNDPSVTDIIGGIGYIIGLTGVAAWFSGRKRKGRQDDR